MVSMIEKRYINQDMNIEVTSCIDIKQNIWFLGEDVAEILGYSDTKQAIKKHSPIDLVGRNDPSGPMVHFYQ